MGWRDWLKPSGGAAAQGTVDAAEVAQVAADRRAAIAEGLRTRTVPHPIAERLTEAREGRAPWIATLTPAELLIARTHGLTPIATVSATCWMQYGRSWTEGHAQGWNTALHRLQMEAMAAGANAVLDVKMRTVPLQVAGSMDFTLVGTAVRLAGAEPSPLPVVATVPALEFVKLLEADVVPVGIAVGAHYRWISDWRGGASQTWMGNTESRTLSQLWNSVRAAAHADLRRSTTAQGNGALAHVNFSQMFEQEGGENQPKQYLARHIVVATVVDARTWRKPMTSIPHEIGMVVDMHAGGTALNGRARHHQSYATSDSEGAI
jgi:uncharacterized protein YbjQ (UPF0145 family)